METSTQIVLIICITIVIIVLLRLKYPSNKKVISSHDLKKHIKNCKYDVLNLKVMSDGTYELEYYDYSDDYDY